MVAPRRRAVFLDRDGVLIRTNVVEGRPYAIRDLTEYELLPGVAESVQRLKKANYVLIVVTNQPDIDNGLVLIETVDSIHGALRRDLPLDGIYMCPHAKRRKCTCRKPSPGILLQAADEFHLDLKNSWMVGDRASDVAAGASAGCRAIFIDGNYVENKPLNQYETAYSLAAATEIILTSEDL